MALDKLNLFGQPQVKPIQATGGQPSAAVSGGSSSNNPFGSKLFSGQTEGINDAVTGTPVYAAAQAGKKAGILGAGFQAIG